MASAEDDEEDFPDTINTSREAIDAYWSLWLVWISTGKRHLPESGGLLDQPSVIMNMFIEMDGLFDTALNKARKEHDDGKAS